MDEIPEAHRAVARELGRLGGRPPKLTEAQRAEIREAGRDGMPHTLADKLAKHYGVSRRQIYRTLASG
jgi:DNA invertase Pin-like site-specific DNA recombinase